ncbi:hypothetical protein PTMSG1_08257 [Pyrenophora teres f. maculata]|nr:hypothetical protein PTMSG1_08257 [Pyrenophora teres f. maculata]
MTATGKDSVAGIDSAAAPNAKIVTLSTWMLAAAFLGIAFYLCAELNVRLLIRATRYSLYFWSCFLCSWGIIVHGIAILLSDLEIWASYYSIIFIELSWLTFVVCQSLVLYSRLNLVLLVPRVANYVLWMIVVNAVLFGLTTVVLGLVARHPRFSTQLTYTNITWDKIQLAAFTAQETIISTLYIRATASHLKDMTLLGSCRNTTRRNLRNLIAVNVFVIMLDATVMVLCYTGFFFLQGFYKAAVYAIKLRSEFTILNQLRLSLPRDAGERSLDVMSGHACRDGRCMSRQRRVSVQDWRDVHVEMNGIRVQRDIAVKSSRNEHTVRIIPGVGEAS